jgi:hypothetical protein
MMLDLVGPWPGHAFAQELLPENPTRWYLTGYLVPNTAPIEQRTDLEAKDDVDAAGEGGGNGDEGQPEKEAAPPSLLPSSIGLSVLVPAATKKLEIEVTWGDYLWEDPSKEDAEPDDKGLGIKSEEKPERYTHTEGNSPVLEDDGGLGSAVVKAPPPKGFRRSARRELLSLPLPNGDGKPVEHALPNSGGLRVVLTLRPVNPDTHSRIPGGTRALCVFLVNGRKPTERAYQANAFQAEIQATCSEGFVPRPDLRGCGGADGFDVQIADLQYRHAFDFVAGVGCSAEPVDLVAGQPCRVVRTCWMPSAEVEFVGHLESSALPGVELGMEALAAIKDGAEAAATLLPLVTHYRAWIAEQAKVINGELVADPMRGQTAQHLVKSAELAAKRMEAGIKLLGDPEVRDAFCTANRAMARQARQREMQRTGNVPAQCDAPAWRAFQLGFILLNLRGLADPNHAEREMVDLLFFPTGGGKTEAYLALAAFSLVLRRLRNPGLRGAGVDVLMRYTLRLLTLDQLGRATALVCALELERKERAKTEATKLGYWPFEIGLWVGSAATPNRMGGPNDRGPGADKTAYKRLRAFKSNSGKNSSPIPLENCPWCGTKFNAHAFRLLPSENAPLDLRITCVNACFVFNQVA